MMVDTSALLFLMLNLEKGALCRRFKMDDRGEAHYLLGMLIKRDREVKILSIVNKATQRKCLEDLEWNLVNQLKHHLNLVRNNDESFDAQTYQQAIGCLTYASVTTRPVIAAAVEILSPYMSRPSEDHWMGVKRILRYLKGTLIKLWN